MNTKFRKIFSMRIPLVLITLTSCAFADGQVDTLGSIGIDATSAEASIIMNNYYKDAKAIGSTAPHEVSGKDFLQGKKDGLTNKQIILKYSKDEAGVAIVTNIPAPIPQQVITTIPAPVSQQITTITPAPVPQQATITTAPALPQNDMHGAPIPPSVSSNVPLAPPQPSVGNISSGSLSSITKDNLNIGIENLKKPKDISQDILIGEMTASRKAVYTDKTKKVEINFSAVNKPEITFSSEVTSQEQNITNLKLGDTFTFKRADLKKDPFGAYYLTSATIIKRSK